MKNIDLVKVLATQLPLVNQTSYCNSNIIVAKHKNLLAMASNPVFSLVNRVRYSNKLVDKDLIWFELKAYESMLWKSKCPQNKIYISRIFLYSWIDEVVDCNNYFASFLHLNYSANLVAIKFLESLSMDFSKNYQVLELIYYCISMGYKGLFKYYNNPDEAYSDWENKLYENLKLS